MSQHDVYFLANLFQHVFLAKLQHVVEWTHRDMQCQRSRYLSDGLEALPTRPTGLLAINTRAQYKEKAQRVITIPSSPAQSSSSLCLDSIFQQIHLTLLKKKKKNTTVLINDHFTVGERQHRSTFSGMYDGFLEPLQ